VGIEGILLINFKETFRRYHLLVYLLLTVLFWFVSAISRFVRSGYVYGLNFELFQPDGGNYLKLTQDLTDLEFDSSSVYSWTRPLYPILSLPFYKLFGINGMLIVPSLSLLAVGLLFQYMAQNSLDKLVLLFCFLVITSSTTVLRWSVADLTDSLHLALFALCCVGIYKQWTLKTLLIIVLLGALARPMGPIWSALFLPFISGGDRKRKREFIILAVTPTLLFFVNTGLMILHGGFAPSSKSLSQQVFEVPLNFLKLFLVEFGQIAVLDRVLFYFVIATLFLSILHINNKWTKAHLTVTFASFLVSAWIGVLGVNFRYQLPLLITGSLVVLTYVNTKYIQPFIFN
jgi:hypothetical protein